MNFSKGENAMNWDALLSVWEDFLAFMDKVIQWINYVFTGEGEWPYPDYPDFDAEPKA